jgi:hypothetical protein
MINNQSAMLRGEGGQMADMDFSVAGRASHVAFVGSGASFGDGKKREDRKSQKLKITTGVCYIRLLLKASPISLPPHLTLTEHERVSHNAKHIRHCVEASAATRKRLMLAAKKGSPKSMI